MMMRRRRYRRESRYPIVDEVVVMSRIDDRRRVRKLYVMNSGVEVVSDGVFLRFDVLS